MPSSGKSSGQIVIVDFGMGNLNSVKKRLSPFGCNPVVSSDPKTIAAADKLILPGVGHFQHAMGNLKELGLIDILNEAVLTQRKPILGICLGLQIMANHSEEGGVAGLGWIDGDVVRFRPRDTLKFKVPHVGWNQIAITKESILMRDIPDSSEFYFVHSFFLRQNTTADILNVTEYDQRFTSAIERDNIFGVQYHPEKSHEMGDRLLRNYASI